MAAMNSIRSTGSAQQCQSAGKAKNKPAEQADRSEPSLLKRKDMKDQLDLSTSARLNTKATDDDAYAAEQPEANNKGTSSCGKGSGKNKSGKALPPGLAKKQAADLPNGNPWKAALEEKEAQAAQAQESAQPQESDPMSMLKNLLEMLLAALTSTDNQEAAPAEAQ